MRLATEVPVLREHSSTAIFEIPDHPDEVRERPMGWARCASMVRRLHRAIGRSLYCSGRPLSVSGPPALAASVTEIAIATPRSGGALRGFDGLGRASLVSPLTA
jgi:hypothetical protein